MRLFTVCGTPMIDVDPDVAESDGRNRRLGSAIGVAARTVRDLSGLAAHGAEFCRGARLSGLCLSSASFIRAAAVEANFDGADLSAVDFSHADLRWASFHDANLSGARLAGANLIGADMGSVAPDVAATIDWTGAITIGMCLSGKLIDRNPLTVTGLRYPVTAVGEMLVIGCQAHSIVEWRRWGAREGIASDGKVGGRFAVNVLPTILAIVDAWSNGD